MTSQFRTRNYQLGDLVHITVRGFRRRRIFLSGADHEEFLEGFHELNEALPAEDRLALMCNAQMPNHQHLFARNGRSPIAISRVMQQLCATYAVDFNWRQRTSGQVFERPFRGRLVRGVEHIMNTFAYIHLNPDDSLRIENSSHGVYLGIRQDPRIDTSLAWRVFGGRDGYTAFFDDTARVRTARADARRRLDQAY